MGWGLWGMEREETDVCTLRQAQIMKCFEWQRIVHYLTGKKQSHQPWPTCHRPTYTTCHRIRRMFMARHSYMVVEWTMATFLWCGHDPLSKAQRVPIMRSCLLADFSLCLGWVDQITLGTRLWSQRCISKLWCICLSPYFIYSSQNFLASSVVKQSKSKVNFSLNCPLADLQAQNWLWVCPRSVSHPGT